MLNDGKSNRRLPRTLVTKCALRPNSRREKLLLALVEQTNKPVAIEALAKKVYGSSRRTAPLHMVALGLGDRLKAGRTGFQLSKTKKDGHVLYGLFRR
jgi:hypothetical protein